MTLHIFYRYAASLRDLFYYFLKRSGERQIQRISRGGGGGEREKSPDPPGLEPWTLLVMSNALTTELWDQTEPTGTCHVDGADKFFTPKAAHNTCYTY